MLTENLLKSRLELTANNGMAYIDFKRMGDTIYLIHTEVPVDLQGRGIGKTLVESSLKYVEEQGWTLRPVCPFVNYYLRKHHEWQRVVDPGYKAKSLAAIELVIPERNKSIGMFEVGRVLPFRKKRMVGPFIYLDRMGPVHFSAEEGLDVPPHPHIGLSTLTYVFEGAITHRDSTGAIQDIVPGEVNVMTAGKGVAHSERSPGSLRLGSHKLFGMQFWIALPEVSEDVEPFFEHYASGELPEWEEYGVSLKLIAGHIGDRETPVKVHSSLFLAVAESEGTGELILDEAFAGERAIYIVNGGINVYGEKYGKGNLVVFNPNKVISVQLTEGTKVMVFGGETFPEERYIWWNFVSSSKEKIETAKRRWKNQEYNPVPEETDYVPLPE